MSFAATAETPRGNTMNSNPNSSGGGHPGPLKLAPPDVSVSGPSPASSLGAVHSLSASMGVPPASSFSSPLSLPAGAVATHLGLNQNMNPYSVSAATTAAAGIHSSFFAGRHHPTFLHHPNPPGAVTPSSVASGIIKPPNRHTDSLGNGGVGNLLSSGNHVGSSIANTNHSSINATQAGQRLKVEDALSYLDQVKMQFQNRPQVYSDFLDIMKDFKSQAIDTPGVIQRVSSLFRGHPTLIVGFNTFLPPGYKIQVDGENGERVSICTPSGTSHIITDEKSGVGGVCGGGVEGGGAGRVAGNSGAPVEFNHAITYVNKIKGRFQHKPEVYKQFLEILHNYQKEQRDLKSGSLDLGHKPLTESQVYASVAKLFSDEPDLLREFSQFLPDAMGMGSGMIQSFQTQAAAAAVAAAAAAASSAAIATSTPPSSAPGIANSAAVQPSVCAPLPPTPAAATLMDRSEHQKESEMGVEEFEARLPPTVPPALRVLATSKPHSHHVHPSGNTPDVPPTTLGMKRPVKTEPGLLPPSLKKTKVEINYDVSFAEASRYGTMNEFQFFDKVRKAFKNEAVYQTFLRLLTLFNLNTISKSQLLELVHPFLGKFPELMKWLTEFLGCSDRVGYAEVVPQGKIVEEERISSDLALEIDYASCKRHGVSYRALPDSYVRPKCSGRTELCNEVLNNTWVSFPSWSSEDTSYVSSKKSQYEEFIYRTEDERFELDIVIEVNRSAIHNLEAVSRRIGRMGSDELKKYRLDDTLGARSPVLMQRAIKRIYGDKSAEILEGLRKNPAVAVPLVLKRLKAKQDEWREAQKGFNRIWREQNEKYYLKALDQQGLSFKQTDLKQMRSKFLINQMEVLYDERHEKMEEGVSVPSGPHLDIQFPTNRKIFYDVTDLLIHHVKRQTGIQKDEKMKIKRLLKQILPDLFGLNREELSDDEEENSEDKSDESGGETTNNGVKSRSLRSTRVPETLTLNSGPAKSSSVDLPKTKCAYSLILVPGCWYVFLRLHQLISDRLAKLHNCALAHDPRTETDATDKEERYPAAQLRCERKPPCPPNEWYSTLINQVKNLLDQQIDGTQYEDFLREMFSTQAYIAFTMDKLIPTMVKQLQTMVTDDMSMKALMMFDKFRLVGGTGSKVSLSTSSPSNSEEAYQVNMEEMMVDQNCFKIYFFHEDGRVTFELLDTDSTEEEESYRQSWSEYVQSYVESLCPAKPPISARDFAQRLGRKPVFLLRNAAVGKVSRVVERRENGSVTVTCSSKDTEDEEDEEDYDTPNKDDVDGDKQKGWSEDASTSSQNKQDTPSSAQDKDDSPPSSLAGEFYVKEELEYVFKRTDVKIKYVSGTSDRLFRKRPPLLRQAAKKKFEQVFLRRRRRWESCQDKLRSKSCEGGEWGRATKEWFLQGSNGEKSSVRKEGKLKLLPKVSVLKYVTRW